MSMISAAVRSWAKRPAFQRVGKVLAFFFFLLALLLMIPVAILLALTFYIRVAITGVGALFGLTTRLDSHSAIVQAPHFMEEIAQAKASRGDAVQRGSSNGG